MQMVRTRRERSGGGGGVGRFRRGKEEHSLGVISRPEEAESGVCNSFTSPLVGKCVFTQLLQPPVSYFEQPPWKKITHQISVA